MASGSSIGDGYGPILASIKPMAPEEIKGKKIAIPGRMTSAYLTLKLFEPDFEEVVVPFDKILDAVAEHLEACFQCQTRVQKLDDTADPIVTLLRQGDVAPTATFRPGDPPLPTRLAC